MRQSSSNFEALAQRMLSTQDPPESLFARKGQIKAFGMLAIGWYLVLQFLLAYMCGLITGNKSRDFKSMVLNLKCWAVMLGVVTGSSSMSFFSLIQDYYKSNLLILYLMPLITFLSLHAIYAVGDSVRYRLAMLNDGMIDIYEEAFDKFSDETENVVIGLAVSHVITQTVRFHLTGTLPAPTGASRPGTEVERSDIISLASSSVLYIIIFIVLEQLMKESCFKTGIKMIMANCVAFALFYSTTWFTSEVLAFQGVAAALVVALGVTWAGFATMICLDALADLDCTGPVFDRNLRLMVMPTATLIGFGWKGAFAAAGVTMVQKVHVFPPPLEQLILALLLILVILPAWRMYILPRVMYDYLKKAKTQSMMGAQQETLEVMLDEEADQCIEKLEQIVQNYQLPGQHVAHQRALALELERLRKISENILHTLENGQNGKNGNSAKA